MCMNITSVCDQNRKSTVPALDMNEIACLATHTYTHTHKLQQQPIPTTHFFGSTFLLYFATTYWRLLSVTSLINERSSYSKQQEPQTPLASKGAIKSYIHGSPTMQQSSSLGNTEDLSNISEYTWGLTKITTGMCLGMYSTPLQYLMARKTDLTQVKRERFFLLFSVWTKTQKPEIFSQASGPLLYLSQFSATATAEWHCTCDL